MFRNCCNYLGIRALANQAPHLVAGTVIAPRSRRCIGPPPYSRSSLSLSASSSSRRSLQRRRGRARGSGSGPGFESADTARFIESAARLRRLSAAPAWPVVFGRHRRQRVLRAGESDSRTGHGVDYAGELVDQHETRVVVGSRRLLGQPDRSPVSGEQLLHDRASWNFWESAALTAFGSGTGSTLAKRIKRLSTTSSTRRLAGSRSGKCFIARRGWCATRQIGRVSNKGRDFCDRAGSDDWGDPLHLG